MRCHHVSRLILLLPLLCASSVRAQTSAFAVRFFPLTPPQQDRIVFEVDDNDPGPQGNTPLDIGAGSFTLEIWLRGRLIDNNTANNGGDIETPDNVWIWGNMLFDRDIWGDNERKFGVSLAGGLVRFGTNRGETAPLDPLNTIEGDQNVLDDSWHHVAVVRDVATGTKYIYVDGVLDFSSSPGVSFADLSYPDEGIPVGTGPGTQETPYGWFLVVGAEKHDVANDFMGFVDEIRIWSEARSPAEIAATFDRVVPPGSPGLVGYYRLEEGTGQALMDTSNTGSPNGELRNGSPGNGEWVSWNDDPNNTAPIQDTVDLIFADSFESGDVSAWSDTSQ